MIDLDRGKYWSESWNPIRTTRGDFHCTKISEGCRACWAESLNLRFYHGQPYDNQPAEFVVDEKALAKPCHWKKPRIVFVCDMMDIFLPGVTSKVGYPIQKIMVDSCQHQYLLLTKRPSVPADRWNKINPERRAAGVWPHVWYGLTVCNQAEADAKLPIFSQVPGHKWLSIEPMLGPVKIWDYLGHNDPGGVEWVVVGAESGLGRRPCDGLWVDSVLDQCTAAGVPCFVKQIHKGDKVSKDMTQWPAEFRCRQLPPALAKIAEAQR